MPPAPAPAPRGPQFGHPQTSGLSLNPRPSPRPPQPLPLPTPTAQMPPQRPLTSQLQVHRRQQSQPPSQRRTSDKPSLPSNTPNSTSLSTSIPPPSSSSSSSPTSNSTSTSNPTTTTTTNTTPGFLFSACSHYHALAPLNLEPIIYPSSLQTTYPCLCNPCDFALRLNEGATIRQLWFDIAVPRYNFLIDLGESTVRPPQHHVGAGNDDNGWIPRTRREYRWVEPVLEEAKRVRESQGKMVVECVRGSVRDFGRRWGEGEAGRLRGELRGVGGRG